MSLSVYEFVLVIVAVVCVACLPSDPGAPGEIGIRVTPSGDVEIRVGHCFEDARITELHVTKTSDRPGELGESVWRVTSTDGSRERRFILGTEPGTFDTPIPLDEPLEPGQRYTIDVIVDDGADLRSGFRLQSLQLDSWYTSPAPIMNDEEFEQAIAEICEAS